MAMFQQQPKPNGQVHVEFRAGMMNWDGKTVTADKRKGKIVLFTSEEEQLMHFQWHDRDKAEVVLDLIVINDAYFEKIEKVKDGRVFLLRFTSNDQKRFFWMQEPKEEGDEEAIKKFNEAIGATPVPKKASGGAAAAGGASGAAGATPGAPVDPQLTAILQQLVEQGGQGGGGAGNRPQPIPMNAVLTPEVLTTLMDDEAAVTEMTGLLPDGHRSRDRVRDALGSPQLQQSLRALTQAVHSDQLPVLFASLGLDPSAIAQAQPGSDALEVLCKAMENKYKGTPP